MNSRANDQGTASASSRYYFLVWLALGAAGIFYVTIASLAPEALHGLDTGQTLESTSQQVASLSTAVGQIKERMDASDGKQQAVASGLDALRGDVGGIKIRLSDIVSLDQSVSTRLSALEGHPEAKTTAGANGGAAATQEIASKATATAPQIDGLIVPGDGTGEPAAPADVSADGATAAPTKKPVKVASAAADAKPKPYSVDLAMSTSTDALRQIWQLFKDQHPELMAGLTPRSVASGANVRLLAGPFPSQAAAAAECAKMRKEGVTCNPTPLVGTPL
jgi:hypothetical protein